MNSKPGTTRLRGSTELAEVQSATPRRENEERRTGGFPAAFTLIELLVVIVIIAILMGITLPLSKYAIARAKQARQEIMIAKIRSALDDYRATYGEYPITPHTNALGQVDNKADAIRHYPDNYATEDAIASNSPFTRVDLTSGGTVEPMPIGNNTNYIDYCLTYPLMLKQLDKGARPFMEFPRVTVTYLLWRTLQDIPVTIRRWSRSGWRSKTLLYISGDPINRPKAVDPVTGIQWHYVCLNGMNYELSTTNSFP